MKKLHFSVLAFVLLLLSVSASASSIFASNANGHHNDQVTLDVSLQEGDVSFGGNFRIGFSRTDLTLDAIDAASGDFSAAYFDFGTGPIDLSLACLTCVGTTPQSLFSLTFTITGYYPSVIDVSIDWFDADVIDFENGIPLDSVISTVTVLAPNDGTVPEPGALGLVGLAMLLMSLGGRRNRVRNDRV